MRDKRAERIHRKAVKRARKNAYRKHNGGYGSPAWYGEALETKGDQGSERSIKAMLHSGSDKTTRTSEYFRIQDRAEARRIRRAGPTLHGAKVSA